jgi:hypothetical protein
MAAGRGGGGGLFYNFLHINYFIIIFVKIYSYYFYLLLFRIKKSLHSTQVGGTV